MRQFVYLLHQVLVCLYFRHLLQTKLNHSIILFYLILVIVTVVFIGTQAALGYALWRGSGGCFRFGA